MSAQTERHGLVRRAAKALTAGPRRARGLFIAVVLAALSGLLVDFAASFGPMAKMINTAVDATVAYSDQGGRQAGRTVLIALDQEVKSAYWPDRAA